MFKKIIPIVILALTLCLNAYAATYHIREDGGNTTECTGQADAPYDGAGSGEACAWDHPWWAVGPGGTNISAGDTVIIHPTLSGNGYEMGIADGNGVRAEKNALNCHEAWAYSCHMGSIPDGIDVNNKTKIYGAGWDTGCANPPELWGSGRVGMIVNLSGSDNVDIRCLDLTDHFEGGYTAGTNPYPCRHSGPYDQDTVEGPGIYANNSTNVYIKDVDIHGTCHKGLHTANIDNWEMVNVDILGNAFVGWDGDIGAVGNHDNITMDNVRIMWNGCVEEYPIVSSPEVNRYHTCKSQSQGGYGDGIGLAAGSCQNWVIKNSTISYNTSDGIDLLYCGGAGNSLDMDRTIITGNAGNQVKTGGGMTVTVDDSVVLGECNYFGQSGLDCDPADCGQSFDDCRAAGNVFSHDLTNGSTVTITNSTLTSEGDCMFLVAGSDNCDGSELLTIRNSLVLGEEDYDYSGYSESTCFMYNSSPSGTLCSYTGTYPISYEIYDSYTSNFKGGAPTGTNIVYNQDPDLIGLTISFTGSGDVDYTNISDPLASDGLKPNVGSPIIGLSDENYGTGVDFFNNSRGAAYDLGALEQETGSGPVCGNNTKEAGETCDGTDLDSETCITQGFDGGTLSCESNCLSFNTTACTYVTCGNGSIDAGEDCDTSGPLLGGATCCSLGFSCDPTDANLACAASTCLYDTTGCTAVACQDGYAEGTEDCDDGNATEGDGCSSLCETENVSYELFLTYTETDPNTKVGVATHKLDFVSLGRSESANLKSDLGAGNIGDFSYDYEIQQDGCVDAGSSTVAYDAGSEATQADATSITFSHTVAAGSNRILVVTVTREEFGTNRSISSVTYDGVAMTLGTNAITTAGNNKVHTYYLLAPNVGTANVVVTYSGQVGSSAVSADSWTGIIQQAPEVVSTSQTSTNNFVTLTDGSLAINSIVGSISSATISSDGDTEHHNFAHTGNHIQGVSSSLITPEGSAGMSWSVSSGDVASTVLVFAPVISGGDEPAIIGIASVASSSHADLKAQEDAGDGLFLYLSCLGSVEQNTWVLRSVDSGTVSDTDVDLNVAVKRYGNIERSGTTVTNKVYTDAARTTLIHQQSLTGTNTTHRYFMTGASYNDSQSGTAFTGSIENIDLTAGASLPATPATESFIIGGQAINGASYP